MFSSTISDTDTALASQYNNLRLDIFDQTSGHNHAGTASSGKKIAHSNLTDGAIQSTYLTHGILNKHVQGDGTDPDPDDDGGESGVHGLGSGIKVAGSYSTQFVLQAGSGSYGSSVTYPTPYTGSIVAVILQNKAAHSGDDHYPTETYFSAGPTTTGFTAAIEGSSYPGGFYWLAIGTM